MGEAIVYCCGDICNCLDLDGAHSRSDSLSQSVCSCCGIPAFNIITVTGKTVVDGQSRKAINNNRGFSTNVPNLRLSSSNARP